MDEHGPFSSMIYLLTMVVFHSYVQLPEGHGGYPIFSLQDRSDRDMTSDVHLCQSVLTPLGMFQMNSWKLDEVDFFSHISFLTPARRRFMASKPCRTKAAPEIAQMVRCTEELCYERRICRVFQEVFSRRSYPTLSNCLSLLKSLIRMLSEGRLCHTLPNREVTAGATIELKVLMFSSGMLDWVPTEQLMTGSQSWMMRRFAGKSMRFDGSLKHP